MLYFITRNAEIYTKVMREIDEADRLGKLSESITYEECLDLPYL